MQPPRVPILGSSVVAGDPERRTTEQRGALFEPTMVLEELHVLVQKLVVTLPAVHGVSVMVQFRGGPFTVAHTSPWARRFADQELCQRDGPSLRSLRTRQVVQVLRAELLARWPALTDAVDDIGIRAVHAEPLPLPQYRSGALALYGTGRGILDPPPGLLQPIRDSVLQALSGYCATHPHQDHAVRLHRELLDRQLRGQAVGILMARHRLTREQAGRLLQEQATARQATVTTTARALVRAATTEPV